jgi:hypothetical protein
LHLLVRLLVPLGWLLLAEHQIDQLEPVRHERDQELIFTGRRRNLIYLLVFYRRRRNLIYLLVFYIVWGRIRRLTDKLFRLLGQLSQQALRE